MGFRDDREANVQRIELLERDLAATKNELEAALLRAAEVEDLRKSVVGLRSERDAMRKGVDPKWASRGRSLFFVCGVLVLVAVAIATRLSSSGTREEADRLRAAALTNSALDDRDAQIEALRRELRAAQAEVIQMQAAHTAELRELRRRSGASAHDGDTRLFVLAHVVSREGAIASAIGDRCVLVLRDALEGYCGAELLCNGAQVFPVEGSPALVRCLLGDGGPWRADGAPPLARARAFMAGSTEALLDYDAAARTLDARAPEPSAFTLHMRVDGAVTRPR